MRPLRGCGGPWASPFTAMPNGSATGRMKQHEFGSSSKLGSLVEQVRLDAFRPMGRLVRIYQQDPIGLAKAPLRPRSQLGIGDVDDEIMVGLEPAQPRDGLEVLR